MKIYNQSPFLPVGYSSSDYYCLQAGGNSNLNLKLSNFSGDQNKPVYIYVDEKIRGTFNVELQNDIVRPIILCYTENTEIAFNNHGHDFRGVIYTPFADLNSFDFDQGTFIGTIFTHDLKLQSKHGKFVFEQFGLSPSDICGTSGLPVELKLVTDPGLSWNKD